MNTYVKVIIPVVHGTYIEETLNSVFNQLVNSNVTIDVVVVKAKAGLKLALKLIWFNDVEVIGGEKDLNTSQARNVGMKHCLEQQQHEGDMFFAFLDEDDLWDNYKLHYTLEALQESGASCCISSCRKLVGNKVTSFTQTGSRHVGCGSNMVVRYRDDDSFLWYDEGLYNMEDNDYWQRWQRTSTTVVVERPLVTYRIHDKSKTHTIPLRYIKQDMLRNNCYNNRYLATVAYRQRNWLAVLRYGLISPLWLLSTVYRKLKK